MPQRAISHSVFVSSSVQTTFRSNERNGATPVACVAAALSERDIYCASNLSSSEGRSNRLERSNRFTIKTPQINWTSFLSLSLSHYSPDLVSQLPQLGARNKLSHSFYIGTPGLYQHVAEIRCTYLCYPVPHARHFDPSTVGLREPSPSTSSAFGRLIQHHSC